MAIVSTLPVCYNDGMAISEDNLNAWAEFSGLAEEYCTLIESLKHGRPPHFYHSLESSLARLYAAILPLEKAMPEKEHPEFDERDLSHDQWRHVAGWIEKAVADEESELVVWHEDVDGDDEHIITRSATLWDDLADVYRDLKNGLARWTIRTPDAQADAARQWRFGYEHHWGSHLFRAMATVHEARYQFNAD